MAPGYTPDDFSVVRHLVENFQASDSPRPSAILAGFLGMVFGVPYDKVTAAEVGHNAYVEGLNILLADGRSLVVIGVSDFSEVNDAIAPYSVTHRPGANFVAFVEKPAPGESFFFGNIPAILDGSLFCGGMLEMLEHVRSYFSNEVES